MHSDQTGRNETALSDVTVQYVENPKKPLTNNQNNNKKKAQLDHKIETQYTKISCISTFQQKRKNEIKKTIPFKLGP